MSNRFIESLEDALVHFECFSEFALYKSIGSSLRLSRDDSKVRIELSIDRHYSDWTGSLGNRTDLSQCVVTLSIVDLQQEGFRYEFSEEFIFQRESRMISKARSWTMNILNLRLKEWKRLESIGYIQSGIFHFERRFPHNQIEVYVRQNLKTKNLSQKISSELTIKLIDTDRLIVVDSLNNDPNMKVESHQEFKDTDDLFGKVLEFEKKILSLDTVPYLNLRLKDLLVTEETV